MDQNLLAPEIRIFALRYVERLNGLRMARDAVRATGLETPSQLAGHLRIDASVAARVFRDVTAPGPHEHDTVGFHEAVCLRACGRETAEQMQARIEDLVASAELSATDIEWARSRELLDVEESSYLLLLLDTAQDQAERNRLKT